MVVSVALCGMCVLMSSCSEAVERLMMAASQSVYSRLFSGKELSARHSKLLCQFHGASSRV
jgi:hypothetical protein